MRKNTHTPWSDVAELVSFDFVKDSQGFEHLIIVCFHVRIYRTNHNTVFILYP